MTAVHFTYDGRPLSAEEGATVAEALRKNGIRLGSLSMRLRVWRDEYHPFKEVPSAWAAIDGIANVNIYRVKIREGMTILPQTKRNLLSYAGRFMGTGFYYRHFALSETARNFFFDRVKEINDFGGPVDPHQSLQSSLPELDFKASERLSPDLLIIGAGRSGLAALSALSSPDGMSVAIIDSLPRSLIEDNFRQLSLDLKTKDLAEAAGPLKESSLEALLARNGAELLENTTVFGAFNGGEYAAVQGYSKVILMRPRFSILCTGAEEVKPVFRKNDIPGVLTSRALLSLPGAHADGSWRPVLYIETPLSLNYLSRLSSAVSFSSVFTGFKSDESYSASIQSIFGLSSQEVSVGRPAGADGTFRLETVTFLTPEGRRSMSSGLLVVAGRKQPRSEIGMLLSLKTHVSQETHVPVPDVDEGMRCSANILACGSLIYTDTEGSIASSMIAGITVSSALGSSGKQPVADALSAMLRRRSAWEPAPLTEQDPESVLCPCMDVTRKDMKRMFSEGYESINRMRRFSGIFMGPCQGARCYRNTFEAFSDVTGKEVDLPTVRPPLVPVYLGALAMTDIGEGAND